MVKGFLQRKGINFFDTYASVAKAATVKIVLAIAALFDDEVIQMDAITAFLNSNLDEEIYVEQPDGFETGGESEDLVWRLLQSLYGLKQSPRLRYQTLATILAEFDYQQSQADNALFFLPGREPGGVRRLILVYVDDFLIVSDKKESTRVRTLLSKRSAMKDLGEATSFLGIHIARNRANLQLTMSQFGYVQKVLSKFELQKAYQRDTPLSSKSINLIDDSYQADSETKLLYGQLIGSLRYLMTQTRPDISYAFNRLSRYLVNPTQQHVEGAKHVLRYLKGSNFSLNFDFSDQKLITNGNRDLDLKIFSNASYGDDTVTSRSTSGYLVTTLGTLISWATQLQKLVSLSSCEPEYYGLGEAVKEALWLKQLLTEIGYHISNLLPLFLDNQSAILLAANPEFHKRTKHVAIKRHFVRQHIKATGSDFSLSYISTNEMPADGLTKALDKFKFATFLQQLNHKQSKA